eukprot:GEMP01096304.1.p1 GENE.GEMP01096304.1~~GEMP01096304.1.p1  ORF type:complete len:149 (+),score=36.86 GEMP01096304.1:105-551(+)
MTAVAQYQKSIGRAVFKGHWGKALELLRTMHHRNLRDTKATNMVMDALIRANYPAKALALLHTLEEPDVASYSTVMRAHPWHRALELMQEMQTRAVTPNVAYSILVHFLCDCVLTYKLARLLPPAAECQQTRQTKSGVNTRDEFDREV